MRAFNGKLREKLPPRQTQDYEHIQRLSPNKDGGIISPRHQSLLFFLSIGAMVTTAMLAMIRHDPIP